MPVKQRGFTLIELLIVLAVIGIASGMALFAFGDFGTARRVIAAAEQFSSYVQLVQQRAILESNTYGLAVDQEGYGVWRLNSHAQWQALPGTGILHRQLFPKQMTAVLHGGLNTREKKPDIIISPTGEMTPFTLDLGSSSPSDKVTVTGNHNGTIFLTNQSTHERIR